MTDDNVYQRRIVAFLDILGFQTHVQRTKDPDYARWVLDVLRFIRSVKEENDRGPLSLRIIGIQVTVFSDSIVISYPASDENALFNILLDIVHLQLNLMGKGVLMRGGVVVGDVYHDGDLVFGPALIDAYKLESELAIYPRVVVAWETVVEGCLRVVKAYPRPEQDLDIIVSLLRATEHDRIYHVDFLRQHEEVDDLELYLSAMQDVRTVIEQELANYEDSARVRAKYEWMRDYFNEVISTLGFETQLELLPKSSLTDLPGEILQICRTLLNPKDQGGADDASVEVAND